MLDIIALPFFQRALIVGLVIALMMALLGVLVVLRNMSFFSDAIGHSALTGIAIALLLGINPFWGALAFALLVAAGIAVTRSATKLSLDTLLGVFFSAAVALGVIIVSLSPGYQADLISFLFGNILTISPLDIAISLLMGGITIVTLLVTGKAFVALSLDQALAQAEGVPIRRYELFFLLLLAANIALAIKFVGIILVTALLITPAASAQLLARSLSHMFVISLVFAALSVIIGLLLSAALAIPSGPAIVLTGALFFVLSLLASRLGVKI